MKDDTGNSEEKISVEKERWEILDQLERWLEWPMIFLAFVWLALLVVEFVRGQIAWLNTASTVIWIIFILDFLVKFIVAPQKFSYLKRNWLTILSLLVPALRVFRIFSILRFVRLARVAGGLRLLRVVASINRSMHALGSTMQRRGFGYVVLLTLLVTFAGAAGMYAFERSVQDERGLHSFSAALWWTAMIMATMGSDYWPRTAEGRLLCLFLAIYAFAVFGYVTATIASFFIGRDAENKEGEIAGQSAIESLRLEIAALREELRHK